jgi:hypothetical protein
MRAEAGRKLKTETISYIETSCFLRNTRLYNPDGCTQHSHRLDNLTSKLLLCFEKQSRFSKLLRGTISLQEDAYSVLLKVAYCWQPFKVQHSTVPDVPVTGAHKLQKQSPFSTL